MQVTTPRQNKENIHVMFCFFFFFRVSKAFPEVLQQNFHRISMTRAESCACALKIAWQASEPTSIGLQKSRFMGWEGTQSSLASWSIMKKMPAVLARRKGVHGCWVGNQVFITGIYLGGYYALNVCVPCTFIF